jgi:hypothetical protein
MTTQTCLALSGVIVTSGATVAVTQGVGLFTAYAAMGAAAGVFYCFLSQDNPAPAKIQTKAIHSRVLLGMMGGVIAPRLTEYIWPWINAYTVDPLLLIGMGFSAAWFFYTMVHKIFQRFV